MSYKEISEAFTQGAIEIERLRVENAELKKWVKVQAALIEERQRLAWDAAREILTRSEHCEHFGVFQQDWDWRYLEFEHWQKQQEFDKEVRKHGTRGGNEL